ncbi:MAG: hypothetical protein WCJ81_01640 [bacterium]
MDSLFSICGGNTSGKVFHNDLSINISLILIVTGTLLISNSKSSFLVFNKVFPIFSL